MTRIELLEKVNELNMRAAPGFSYWTVVVLYNHVIWQRDHLNRCTFHEVVGKLVDEP